MDFVQTILHRKIATTNIYCAVADFDKSSSTSNQDSSNIKAPFYRGYNQITSTVCTSELLKNLLVKFSDKWTRLDEYPNALPTPPRTNKSFSKKDNCEISEYS